MPSPTRNRGRSETTWRAIYRAAYAEAVFNGAGPRQAHERARAVASGDARRAPVRLTRRGRHVQKVAQVAVLLPLVAVLMVVPS